MTAVHRPQSKDNQIKPPLTALYCTQALGSLQYCTVSVIVSTAIVLPKRSGASFIVRIAAVIRFLGSAHLLPSSLEL